jgi:cell division protein ZipA
VLDIAILIILVIVAFAGVAWYANRSSKQRRALLDDIDNIEPEMGESSQFGTLFEQELNQQTIDSERFDIDAEPTITLSDDAASHLSPITESKHVKAPAVEAVSQADKPMPSAHKLDVVEDSVEIDLPEQTHTQHADKPQHAKVVKDWDMVIAFTVMAREGTMFSGRSIKMVLESLDLHFGDMQIYHRQVPGLRSQTLFSVANILDPGTLKPDSFATMKTPGLLLFSRLPGPVNGLTVFDDLLDCAQKMTDKLDGVLSDESRQAVSQSTIEAMRSKILSLNLQLQAENSHYNNDY